MSGYYGEIVRKPDSSLAKMIGGGGLGGFLTNMSNGYLDLGKRRDKQAQQEKDNQFTMDKIANAQAMTDVQNRYADITQQKLDYTMSLPTEMDILEQDNKYKVALEGLRQKNNLAVEEVRRKNNLALQAAKNALTGTKPVGSFGEDIYIDGYSEPAKYNNKTGEVLAPDGKVLGVGAYRRVNAPKTPEDKIKEIELREKEAEIDSTATQYVDSAISEYEDGLKGSARWIGDFFGDDSEARPLVLKELRRMYLNGETRGISKEQAVLDAYRNIGAPSGLFGGNYTNSKRVKTFVSNAIGGNDSKAITDDVVKKYLDLNGIDTKGNTIPEVTAMFKAMADSRANKKVALDNFASKYGLNAGSAERFSNTFRKGVFSALDLAQKLGINPIGKDGEWAEKAQSAKTKLDNWGVANQQMDAARLVGEVYKYAPTAGLNPVSVGSRFMNVLANTAKFSTAEGMLAAVYGDDWKTAAAAGAIPASVMGLFQKVKKATPK